MNRPLPLQAQAARMSADAHAGLWHEKFFDAYDENWKCKLEKAGEWLKRTWGTSMPVGDATLIGAYQQRLEQLRSRIDGDHRDFETTWHFATGLGNPHPSKNGFVWHPTLGVPYLPSSGVKGLLNGWLDWQGIGKATCARRWLGTPTQAGALIFFDALPVSPVAIGADVMTPHMGEWYEKGASADPDKPDNWKSIPADWHNPKPITFLVVKQGAFRFMIAPTARARGTDMEDALDQLKGALEFLGAGAKTAAGYGRMNSV